MNPAPTAAARIEPTTAAPVLAAVVARVPHYSGGAVLTGSVIFIVLVGGVALAVLRRRR